MARTKEDLFRIIGASNHCADEREAVDFYSTDPECVRDLISRESFQHSILEPCCGNGNIAKELTDIGFDVTATDLYDHGYGTTGVDCFDYTNIDQDIITNPPYSLTTEFIEHMINELKSGHKMALFLKLQVLEGQARYQKIFSQGKLRRVYVYVNRVACYKNDERYQKNDDGSLILDKAGNPKKIGSAACYAWFIFDSDYSGYPEIRWIVK
jgi:methylase of polypeptide subunit release factors